MSQSMKRIDWAEVENFIGEVRKHQFKYPITSVYAIPRGGLVMGVMLSHKLRIPLVMAPTKGTLIVDDIADTGETLKRYESRGYAIATLCYKEQSTVKPDIFGIIADENEWVVFPWECEYED